MLTHTIFTCFADVEAYYNKIKPIRSTRFTLEEDIRPIGDRRRYYERIVRVSPNCYALCDWDAGGASSHLSHYMFPPSGYVPSLDDVKMMAPIVWERHADGTETVRLRNGRMPGWTTSRYKFLYRHTPRGLWMRQTRVGMQFIEANHKKHFLPKHRSIPVQVYENARTKTSQTQRLHPGCDGKYLVFRKGETCWEHIYGDFVPKRPSAPPVDREAKAAHKPQIEEFYQWACAMLPMLPKLNTHTSELPMLEAVQEFLKERDINHHAHVRWRLYHCSLPSKHACDAVASMDHPLRMFALHHMQAHVDDIAHVQSALDAKKFRAQFNRWVNKFCSFINME